MNDTLRQQALDIVKFMMRTYYTERDIDAVIDCFDEVSSWIGPGGNERKLTKQDAAAYFCAAKDAVPRCVITSYDLTVREMGEEYCLVEGAIDVRTDESAGALVAVNQRISCVLYLRDGQWKVTHLHNSNPYAEMGMDELFPWKVGTQSYEYLQQILREKNEVLDMITSNISGGLKGSNDDDDFSYFYVNEGLPKMLGYTYDEFMAKTGGTAKGAVYPPDLPGALEDCARCFAVGPEYSTEYRMEKKDGTLIWVIDSGRKARNSEGEVKINSIITDVTPMKQMLFELEVERERYRMALESVTDVMCEYDIEKDVFTTFKYSEVDGKKNLERLDIENFSSTACSREMVHLADCDKLLDVYCGRINDSVEVRTKYFHSADGWRWSRVHCSVIYDLDGTAVKTVGMMKDVTEERAKNLELIEKACCDGMTGLLNQTTMAEEVEQYFKNPESSGVVLMVDMDDFKTVNDTLGHLFGDVVLQAAARVLREQARKDDLVGRIGGDEFLMLLKGADVEVAKRKAQAIIENMCTQFPDCTVKVSCSVGIVPFDHKTAKRSYNLLFHNVDEALYSAKRKGKQQWFLIED